MLNAARTTTMNMKNSALIIPNGVALNTPPNKITIRRRNTRGTVVLLYFMYNAPAIAPNKIAKNHPPRNQTQTYVNILRKSMEGTLLVLIRSVSFGNPGGVVLQLNM
jgi:hypothetical protein